MKTFIKTIFKCISNNKSRFISMSLIILVGICFVTGLGGITPKVENSLNEVLTTANAPDIILKTRNQLGFTQGEIENLNRIDDIDVEFITSFDQTTDSSLRTISLDFKNNKINKLTDFINECNSIVFFGGAGVSTESGIPDFRSKDGLYNQHDIEFDMYEPEYLLSEECLHHKPKVFFEFYRQKMDARNVKPNITHYMLARLEKLGKLDKIITQNIDGLHQMAGSTNVIELHGATTRNYCEKCGKKYPADYIFESREAIPRCVECNHMIRPDVTLYGEQLPAGAYESAVEAIRKADMLIVAGTSLKVYPAAGLVWEFAGKHLVVMNKEPLDFKLDMNKDIEFNCAMGDVFRALDKNI